jgi:hypothetical protein
VSIPWSTEGEEHVTDSAVAAYLDRRLPPDERTRLVRHLIVCEDCRLEVSETQALLTRRGRRRWFAAAGLIAAAALLVLVLRPIVAPSDSPSEIAIREGGTSVTLTAYGPVGEVGGDSLRLLWAAAPGATVYRVSLSAAGGRALWSASTVDTSLILPDSARLETGLVYYWVADALLANGTTRSTGLRGFQILR